MWHQTLSVRGVLSMALFTRGGAVFLAIAQANAGSNSLLLRWSSNEFTNFQEVPISGTTQVEALTSGDDIYLIFAKTLFLGKTIECLQAIYSCHRKYLAFILCSYGNTLVIFFLANL